MTEERKREMPIQGSGAPVVAVEEQIDEEVVTADIQQLLAPQPVVKEIGALSYRLCGPHVVFARGWFGRQDLRSPWRRQWAASPDERLRTRCVMDALVAHAYGLNASAFAWVVRDCDHPTDALRSTELSRLLDPEGFWRVDRDLDPELRLPVLAQVAFHDLQTKGLDAFLAQNDGEGFMLPGTLRLADFGLGHDDRARKHQLVAARLGPRFLPWQLEQSVEESWEECARHAEILDQLLPRP